MKRGEGTTTEDTKHTDMKMDGCGTNDGARKGAKELNLIAPWRENGLEFRG
jgi:hypothetical protein